MVTVIRDTFASSQIRSDHSSGPSKAATATSKAAAAAAPCAAGLSVLRAKSLRGQAVVCTSTRYDGRRRERACKGLVTPDSVSDCPNKLLARGGGARPPRHQLPTHLLPASLPRRPCLGCRYPTAATARRPRRRSTTQATKAGAAAPASSDPSCSAARLYTVKFDKLTVTKNISQRVNNLECEGEKGEKINAKHKVASAGPLSHG